MSNTIYLEKLSSMVDKLEEYFSDKDSGFKANYRKIFNLGGMDRINEDNYLLFLSALTVLTDKGILKRTFDWRCPSCGEESWMRADTAQDVMDTISDCDHCGADAPISEDDWNKHMVVKFFKK